FDGKNVTHIFDFKKDILLQNNELDALINTEEVQDMVAYLKAYIQQYVERMNSDNLTVSNEHQ
ncbi:MAG: hypothetical protein II502_04895, partial [Paludibacteraceae bacterium]|nr:hypothetical protein [Paludibacteraceae bacterium]